jgi:sigma-B regulation protein RsbU (phosphoserine phosphatase)
MNALHIEIQQLLIGRRDALVSIMEFSPGNPTFFQLLAEVDSAIKRADDQNYGICEVCGKVMEEAELLANPLLTQCLSHLPAEQLRKIYQDLGFAEVMGSASLPDDVKGAGITMTPWTSASAQEIDLDINRARVVQAELLPESHVRHETWDIFYEFIPSGPLSGDYCDLVRVNPREIFLMFGDAMGKGITACMTSCRLHTLFRTLLELNLPLTELVERANRIFCQCVLTSGHYATLLCGRATPTGTLELVNAGHLPPLVLRNGGVERVMSSGTKGLPLGLFFESSYEVSHIQLEPGETLLCYTDGLTEARDSAENEYGYERLAEVALGNKDLAPEELVRVCREDVAAYTSKSNFSDDFTLLALRRVA